MKYYLIAPLKLNLPPLEYESRETFHKNDIVKIAVKNKSLLGIVISEVAKPKFKCKEAEKSTFALSESQVILGHFVAKYYCVNLSVAFGIFTLGNFGNASLGGDSGNSSLGMQFRTCENFGDFADTKSSLNPQNSHKYKSHTANTRIVNSNKSDSSLRESALADSWQSTKNSESMNSSLRGVANAEAIQKNKINPARSANPRPTRHTEATKSPKYPLKSFCYFWLKPKVESSLPYQPKSTQKGNFADSANPLPLNSLVFSRKRAAPPSPLPLRAKSCRFSLLGGEPRNSDSSKKSAGGTTAPFVPDFLHHESGEIRGANARLFCLDCHDLTSSSLAMTKYVPLDSMQILPSILRNYRISHAVRVRRIAQNRAKSRNTLLFERIKQ